MLNSFPRSASDGQRRSGPKAHACGHYATSLVAQYLPDLMYTYFASIHLFRVLC